NGQCPVPIAEGFRTSPIPLHWALGIEHSPVYSSLPPLTSSIVRAHDELVLEAPEEEVDVVQEVVRGHMEGAAELGVPLRVEMGIGENWLEAKG
ncbi:MAG TPA: DNA polymerase, partial [Gemmatimonadales bacterium]